MKRLHTIIAAATAIVASTTTVASGENNGLAAITKVLGLSAKNVQNLGSGSNIEVTPVQVTRIVKALRALGYRRNEVGDDIFAMVSGDDTFFVSEHNGKSYVSLDVE